MAEILNTEVNEHHDSDASDKHKCTSWWFK